jgi:hypothetical protein
VKQVKKLINLPPEVRQKFLTIREVDERDQYIVNLRSAGWTLTSIAEVCGITRERIRQIIIEAGKAGLKIDLDSSFNVPQPPNHPVKPKREYVEPSADTLSRLLELQPLAQQVRSNATRYRAEAEEYVRLLNHAHTIEGVPLYRLGKRLGVSHAAIRFRLARYGYKASPNGASKVYKPIASANRVTL